jgi:AraC family transcriptional regulator, regulatory protein of adaptative response / methylphosphotriester-DNA alkyltransferase methyltransferase
VRHSTEATRRRLYAEAAALVEREYRGQLTLALLAGALASSPRQLQRAYAEVGSTTFREQLTARRLRAGAELLAAQPGLSIAQIAQLVGYRHAPHFTRLFRQHYGRAPGDFRAWARGGPTGGGVQVQPPPERPAATGPPSAGSSSSSPSSSRSPGADSSPGRRRRISVPPPGAGSALIAPPC